MCEPSPVLYMEFIRPCLSTHLPSCLFLVFLCLLPYSANFNIPSVLSNNLLVQIYFVRRLNMHYWR